METRRRTAEIWRHARAPPRPGETCNARCNVKQAKGNKGVQGEGPVSYWLRFSYTRTRTVVADSGYRIAVMDDKRRGDP